MELDSLDFLNFERLLRYLDQGAEYPVEIVANYLKRELGDGWYVSRFYRQEENEFVWGITYALDNKSYSFFAPIGTRAALNEVFLLAHELLNRIIENQIQKQDNPWN